MSLKSIRDSYSKLLTSFNDAGIKLNESQKADLDTFIIALESKMSNQKEATIKATKKVVTEHLEKEYKKVFESILKHQQENSELAAKVQDKITKLNESKKIADKVSNYLDLYVESVLPKKTIVDYDRMNKLETVMESLKDTLLVNEDSVEAKKAQLTESFNKQKKALETQIAKLQVQLNESMEKSQKLNKKIDGFKAIQLLESKTKDLPDYEARQMKKRFAEATTTEIEKKFDKVLDEVKEELADAQATDAATLEDEVKDIIEAEDVAENDMLKGHNLHIDEGEWPDDRIIDWLEDDGYDGLPLKPFLNPTPEMKKLLNTLTFKVVGQYNGMPQVEVGGSDADYNWFMECSSVVGKDKDPRYQKIIKLAMQGDKSSVLEKDESLYESDVIDANLMKLWCEQAARINTDIVRC